MKPIPKALEAYAYDLPEKFIAQQPAVPRDAAKLLVYDRGTKEIFVNTFRNLADFLPKNAVLVFNQTKVIPARLTVQKETGGKVILLFLSWSAGQAVAISDRKISIGQRLSIGKCVFTVSAQHGGQFTLRFRFSLAKFLHLLQAHGSTPIPPYIKHSPLSEQKLQEQYQAVFAKRIGSVAAPTASLHFTKGLLTKLKRKGVAIEYVTLHVNLGTFAPVTETHLKTGTLHTESYEIDPAAAARLNRYKQQGRPIIAVGTTVARTLESAQRRGRLKPGKNHTSIFIRPGYQWKFVNELITNFHVPRSSLMMLVASLTGREELLSLYEFAKKKQFRFFSFGDGMFIR